MNKSKRSKSRKDATESSGEEDSRSQGGDDDDSSEQESQIEEGVAKYTKKYDVNQVRHVIASFIKSEGRCHIQQGNFIMKMNPFDSDMDHGTYGYGIVKFGAKDIKKAH